MAHGRRCARAVSRRRAAQVTVIAYSDVERPDAVTARLRGACALFREVAADPYWAIGRRTLWEGLARSVAHNGYRWYRARRVLGRP